jgi:hypothetical protein
MLRLFKRVIILLVALICTACANSVSNQNASIESTSPEPTISVGEEYTSKLRDSLFYNLKLKSAPYVVWPFFIDEDRFEVKSDANFDNLEINVRSWISNEDKTDFQLGQTLAMPQKGGLPDTSQAMVICAKDVMQTFATWSLFLMEGVYPKQSLKISIEYYTVTGSTKEDAYGNVDTSGLKEKTLVKSKIHISNSNLTKISDPWGPDDYYALSDLSKPVRHLAAWNNCKSYNL